MSCQCYKQKNTQVRRSCLQCVEKHLGAAIVLMGEVLNGYPHRLLAIGHLHEAEEESQEWPALHAAIRHDRTRYQDYNMAPDWERLDKLVQSIAPSRHGITNDLRAEYDI